MSNSKATQSQPKTALILSSPTPVQLKPKRKTAPTMSKATLALIQYDYVQGNFKSIAELASRYSCHENTLLQRINREKWEDLRLRKIQEIEARMSEKAQSIGEKYLENTKKRMKRYEDIIDASINQSSSRDINGIPVLEPKDINDYTLSEQRINTIAMQAHRIPSISQVDTTSKGQSVGDSIVSALERLRSNNTKPVIVTMEQAEQLAEYEIVKDNQVPKLGNSK